MAESSSPSSRERSSRRGAEVAAAPSTPGRAKPPLPPEGRGLPGKTPPSAPGPAVPVAVGTSSPRHAREDETPGGAGSPGLQPAVPYPVNASPRNFPPLSREQTELGMRLAAGTAPELRRRQQGTPVPPAPLLSRGDGGRERRGAWRSPQPCCFLFHA